MMDKSRKIFTNQQNNERGEMEMANSALQRLCVEFLWFFRAGNAKYTEGCAAGCHTGQTVILLCFLLVVPAFLSAQSTAQEIEILLETQAVTYGQAARFILEASDVLASSDPEEAFTYAAAQTWLPKGVMINDRATLEGVALLLMGSFDVKGGIFYSLFRSPHYAYRELVYQGYVQGRIDPGMAVSGDTLLFIIGRALSQREGINP